MKIDDIKKVTVIGAGAMGHGIAQVCVMAGVPVTMVDIREEFLENGVKKVRESLDFLVGKGKMTGDDAEKAMGLLSTQTDLAGAVKDARLIIEAVPEKMDLKKSIFKTVSDNAPKDAILASNTSTMSITEISATVENPERFAGMHFFNPVTRMKMVEVIYGEKTSDEVINTLYEFSEKIKKMPVKVMKDRPGFIVNRINAPVQPLLGAILDEGKIPPDAIDNAQKKLGMKMGPFELLDFVGLDVVYNGAKYYEETLSPDYKPGKFLTEKMDRNELGMKTGKGIYDWSSGKAAIDESKETMEIGPGDFIAILLNEAIKVRKQGIAESVDDINRAQVAGMNAIAGPFQLAAGMDPASLAESLNKLSKRYNLDILKPEPEIADGSFKEMK